MALLQWSDVRGLWHMNGPTASLLEVGQVTGLSPTIFSLQKPSLQTAPSKDISGLFLNADSGYRASYGRYYTNATSATNILSTDSVAGYKEVWDGGGTPLIDFSYAFVFRDISTGTGSSPGRILMSKPSTDTGAANAGNQLSMDDGGTADKFAWRCFAADGVADIASILNVPKNKWIIGYVIKADGVASKLGLKVKGETSWTTAVSPGSITVDYDTTKDAALMGQVNTSTGALENPFWGDLQGFCVWGAAITEATMQSSVEDHFGMADDIIAGFGKGSDETLGSGRGIL